MGRTRVGQLHVQVGNRLLERLGATQCVGGMGLRRRRFMSGLGAPLREPAHEHEPRNQQRERGSEDRRERREQKRVQWPFRTSSDARYWVELPALPLPPPRAAGSGLRGSRSSRVAA